MFSQEVSGVQFSERKGRAVFVLSFHLFRWRMNCRFCFRKEVRVRFRDVLFSFVEIVLGFVFFDAVFHIGLDKLKRVKF